MAGHESESNQGCLLFDLSFLARSRADGTGCLCMLNDSPSQLFRERQLFLEVMCLRSLRHTRWPATSCRLQRLDQALRSDTGLQGKQVRAGDADEMPFPKSPGSGEVSHHLPRRLRVTSGSEPRGPKKHRGVALHHSTGINIGALILNSLT